MGITNSPGHLDLLGVFTVLVGDSETPTDNAVCGRVTDPALSNVAALSITCQQTLEGRYVYILLPGVGRTLNLAEVQVLGTSGAHLLVTPPVSEATIHAAAMSSSDTSFPASNCINGVLHDFCHTSASQAADPWLTIENRQGTKVGVGTNSELVL